MEIVQAYPSEDLSHAIARAIALAPCVMRFNNIYTAVLPGDAEMQVWAAHNDQAMANYRDWEKQYWERRYLNGPRSSQYR